MGHIGDMSFLLHLIYCPLRQRKELVMERRSLSTIPLDKVFEMGGSQELCCATGGAFTLD